jgi:hypothetical protein
MRRLSIFGIIIALVVFFSGCGVTSSSQSNGGTATGSPSSTFGPEPNWGVQTKTTGCQADGPIQDKACTPGDIFPDATKEKICVPGYASSVRNVTQSTKTKVYSAYGVKTHSTGQYEVDHLVSLQLGGSNDISNLWPEPASPTPGFHEKDRVENYLHDQICKGSITLREAQIEIATNWLAVYQRMSSSSTNDTDQDEEQS